MVTVHSPVEGFTGTVAAVEFTDGKGETSDRGALAYFRRKGYGIGEEPDRTADEPVPTEPVAPHVKAGSPLRDAATDPSGDGASDADLPAGEPGQSELEEPAGNAPTEEWRAYAVARGAAEDDVADLGRNELREQYGS